MSATWPHGYREVRLCCDLALDVLDRQIRTSGDASLCLDALQRDYAAEAPGKTRTGTLRAGLSVEQGARAEAFYAALFGLFFDAKPANQQERARWCEALIGAAARRVPQWLSASAFEISDDGACERHNWASLADYALSQAALGDYLDPKGRRLEQVTARFDNRWPAWRTAYSAGWCAPGIREVIDRGDWEAQTGWRGWVYTQAALVRETPNVGEVNAAELVLAGAWRGIGPREPGWADVLVKTTAAGVTLDAPVWVPHRPREVRDWGRLGDQLAGLLRSGNEKRRTAARAWSHWLVAKQLRPFGKAAPPVPRL